MSETKKRKVFAIEKKMDIPAATDSEEMCYTGCRLGVAPSPLNTVVKNRKDIFKVLHTAWQVLWQRKSLKLSPFQELESCWLCGINKLRVSRTVIIGTLLREKAVYTLPQGWAVKIQSL
jgi:hypothetical protein